MGGTETKKREKFPFFHPVDNLKTLCDKAFGETSCQRPKLNQKLKAIHNQLIRSSMSDYVVKDLS